MSENGSVSGTSPAYHAKWGLRASTLSPGLTSGFTRSAASRASTGSWFSVLAVNARVTASEGTSTAGTRSSLSHQSLATSAHRGDANAAAASNDHSGSIASE